MFKDKISLFLKAGKGGNGVIAFRREKFIPKGGPSGGNGGNGGSIILKVDKNLFSLENFRNKKIIKASDGQDGSGSDKIGKTGKDLIIKVPPGTLVKDADTDQILFDLVKDQEEIVICKGGKGGLGNLSFKSSTNQTPHFAKQGALGEEKKVLLELKLIADIGLVGFPNAGKSTFFSLVTNTKNIKIASYPFTTLNPNIGVIEFEDYTRCFIADIPGIIEKAHLNKGLGLSFLKHIERTSLLLFIIDISNSDPVSDYEILKKEILKYDKNILKKPYLIVLNKIDEEESQKNINLFLKHFSKEKNIFKISALKNIGVEKLLKSLKKIIQSKK